MRISDLIHAARTGNALISFPTDTVPALASHPDHAHLIFEAKQRSTDKPLILMGGEAEDLWPYVTGTPDEERVWKEVAARHWPGALTLVLPASDRIPVAMNPQTPTSLGIRVPNRAIARHILAQTGPLATTSVNRSGEPPLTTITAINQSFPEVLTLSQEELDELERSLARTCLGAPDTGTKIAPPSTVAQWTGDSWTILRQGGVPLG
jgi:L-threonylcarbamoyladenylate synthase